jgi:glycosyltransferase involved in cell wall biosynthesis
MLLETRWHHGKKNRTAVQSLVTIVVACSDNAGELRSTLGSIFAQTFANFEIIVVHSSSDDVSGMDRPDPVADPRIHVMRLPGAALGDAWNAGVEQASDDYVCCLAAGQELAPTYLEKCLFVLETSQSGICLTQQQESTRRLVAPRPRAVGLEWIMKEYWVGCLPMFRKDSWDQAGRYDARMMGGCENWDLCIRMAKLGVQAQCIPGPLVHQRADGVGASRHAALDAIRQKYIHLYRNPDLARAAGVQTKEGPVFSYARLLASPRVPKSGLTILLAMPALTMGGAEAIVSQICHQLKERGLRIFVISTDQPLESQGDTSQWFEQGVAEIYHLPHFLEIWRWPGFIFYLLQQYSVDILWQVGSGFVYDLMPDIKQYFPGIAIVDLLFNPVGHTANYLKYNCLIDHVVTEHAGMKTWLLEHGETEENVSVIPNGVDLQRFSPRARDDTDAAGAPSKAARFVAGFIGRLSEEKAPDLFIEIAARLARRREMDFIICGTGPLYPELQARVRAKGLAARVRFLGFVDTSEYLQNCDVVVVCSRMDGRPNIVMEAAAMGVPVVASRVGGIPEMVADGVTGRLCDTGDVAGFSDAILELADHADVRVMMGHSARQWAEEHFGFLGTVTNYASLFERLARKQAEQAKLLPRTEAVPLLAIQPRPRPARERQRTLIRSLRTLIIMLSPHHLISTLRNAVLWAMVRRNRERTALFHSLFDKSYYLSTYRDVADSGIPPLLHYLFYGFLELRNPSDQFDTEYYLRQHPDVAVDRVNPLLHYVLHGKNEGLTSAAQAT